MMSKMRNMIVSSNFILWINNFLTLSSQYVNFKDTKSSVITTNVGVPQGCVLSPILFTTYTSDCVCCAENCQLFKYIDNSVLVGWCGGDDAAHWEEGEKVVAWCANNYLKLNVEKTKETVVDCSTSPFDHPRLFENGETVEQVQGGSGQTPSIRHSWACGLSFYPRLCWTV